MIVAQFVNIFPVELNTEPASVSISAYEGDANSLRVGAQVTDGGAYTALGGSCVGKVIRADGATVPLTGTISGNLAYVVLDQTCCAVEGPVEVSVIWVSGGNKTTLLKAYGIIVRTETGNAIQPSTPIPDLTELLAEIDEMRAATADAQAAAAGALANFAGAFSDATAYTAGQYVTYTDGYFYRFTADHAAGAWSSSDVERVTTGGELNDIQSAVEKALPAVTGYAYPFPATTWASSSSINQNTGEVVTPDPDWSASDYIEIDPLYGSLKIVASGTSTGIYNAYYDEGKNYISALTWSKNTTTILTPPANAKYIRLSKLDGTTLTVSLIPRDLKTWALMSREPVSTDFNDFDLPGLYMLFANETYINSPDNTTTRRCLFVFRYPDEDYTAQLFLNYYDEHTRAYMRVRSGATPTWQDWHLIYDAEKLREGAISAKTVSESFTPTPQSAHGNNTGTNLRIMQYNVAHYNHDTATYLPSDKAFNFRKLLRATNPDVLLLQEDNAWIDGPEPTGTKSTKEYLYNPQYPYGTGDGDVTIRAKFQTTSNGVVKTSVDRSIRYGILTIDEKAVLLVSCHAPWGYEGHDGESAEAKAARATYYQEVCKWCAGGISLPDYYTQNPTSAPEHTYVIIGMDANCVTADDKTALLNAASTYGGYTLGNGGELGWVYSCFDSYGLTSIDEIMVSPNIIINGFEVLGNWFNLLYSDHYPVVADLTLL